MFEFIGKVPSHVFVWHTVFPGRLDEMEDGIVQMGKRQIIETPVPAKPLRHCQRIFLHVGCRPLVPIRHVIFLFLGLKNNPLHFPTDVLCGALVGAGLGWGAAALFRRSRGRVGQWVEG